MTMEPVVHVIDDDAGQRDAMRCLLASVELQAVCYATAQAFLDMPATTRPGCIVLDLRMPGMSGLELQRAVSERPWPMPTIFLSGHADVETSVRAMQQGATEFLIKPVSDEKLLETIHAAIESSRRGREEYKRQSTLQARWDLLSPREQQVLDGVFEGFSNKDIARQLGISHKTVELHRSNMMAKMHADSLAEVVRMRIELEPLAKTG